MHVLLITLLSLLQRLLLLCPNTGVIYFSQPQQYLHSFFSVLPLHLQYSRCEVPRPRSRLLQSLNQILIRIRSSAELHTSIPHAHLSTRLARTLQHTFPRKERVLIESGRSAYNEKISRSTLDFCSFATYTRTHVYTHNIAQYLHVQ
jgi:hypothetical protein